MKHSQVQMITSFRTQFVKQLNVLPKHVFEIKFSNSSEVIDNIR